MNIKVEIMASTNVRLELHRLIDRVDDQFIQAVHSIVEAYIKKDEIVGYEVDGTPILTKDFIDQSNQSIKAMQSGTEGISVNELEQRSKKWLSPTK